MISYDAFLYMYTLLESNILQWNFTECILLSY